MQAACVSSSDQVLIFAGTYGSRAFSRRRREIRQLLATVCTRYKQTSNYEQPG